LAAAGKRAAEIATELKTPSAGGVAPGACNRAGAGTMALCSGRSACGVGRLIETRFAPTLSVDAACAGTLTAVVAAMTVMSFSADDRIDMVFSRCSQENLDCIL
jgi:hypothetical protein